MCKSAFYFGFSWTLKSVWVHALHKSIQPLQHIVEKAFLFYCSTLSMLFYHVCLAVLLNSFRLLLVYISILAPKRGYLTPRLWNKTRYQMLGWLSDPDFPYSFSIVLALLIYCITCKLWVEFVNISRTANQDFIGIALKMNLRINWVGQNWYPCNT